MRNKELINQICIQSNDLSIRGVIIVLLFGEGSSQKIFIVKRAEGLPSHKGQMAFLGGHRECAKENLFTTAEREFTEETGGVIPFEEFQICDMLPAVTSLNGSRFLPLVFRTSSHRELDLVTNPFLTNGEWEEGYLFPLDFFIKEGFHTTATFCLLGNINSLHSGLFYPLPPWVLAKYVISHSHREDQRKKKESQGEVFWGLSAMVLKEILVREKYFVESIKEEKEK